MLTTVFHQVIFFFYTILGDNLGLAIIALTLVIKLALMPLTLNSLKSAEKMRRLQPRLNKLKKKHKDPKKLQEAQLKLFKQHNVNPLASLVPQVVQIGVFILLYKLLIGFLKTDQAISTTFLWLDLTKPDPYYILPVLAGLSQFGLSYLMKPKTSPKESQGTANDITASMGKSMLYVMPLITAFFATKFPAGLVVYWITSNLFSLGQQYYLVKNFKNHNKEKS